MAQIPFITDNCRNNIPVNWYPAKDSEFGVVLWGTPGLTVKTTGQNVCRGMAPCVGEIYGVSGSRAWKLTSSWVLVEIGTLIGNSGPVTILDNGLEVFFQEDAHAYTYTISTGAFSEIVDSAFPDPSSAAYQDGYFIVSQKDSNKFYISGLYAGTTWDALDFASAEGSADLIVGVRSAHRELWLFNERTVEVWYNSGDADFPFAKVSGANIEMGCRSEASIRLFNGSFVWLSDRLQVVKNVGYQPQIISTRKLERIIETLTTSDAWAYTYVQDGHEFYVLNFPTSKKTYVYDAETQVWHRRESQGCLGRHRISCAAQLPGMHVAGDFENGKIYEMNSDVYTEDGDEIIRSLETNSTQDTSKEGRLVHFSGLEVTWEGAGKALEGGLGSNPQAMLQWSDDGGSTWGNEHWSNIGLIGKYKNRCRWNRLGASRDRVWRLMLSDPVNPTILGAFLGMK